MSLISAGSISLDSPFKRQNGYLVVSGADVLLRQDLPAAFLSALVVQRNLT
jgi:hypothetical protein